MPNVLFVVCQKKASFRWFVDFLISENVQVLCKLLAENADIFMKAIKFYGNCCVQCNGAPFKPTSKTTVAVIISDQNRFWRNG